MAVKETRKVKKIPCEIYSRIVGYYRPTFTWNLGQQAQYKARKTYKIGKTKEVGKN